MTTGNAIRMTQATLTFDADIEGVGSCEVKATWFLGRVTINAVRRNSDHAFVTLDDAGEHDVKAIVGWYVEDRNAAN